MYTEEYERKGFPIRDFILKLVLVVIFVFLLVWLLPKFIQPTVNTTTKQCGNVTCDTKGIDALTSQIFADNIDRMKEAAISYYTDERLPQEVGKSEKLTLSDMIGLKIITPLVDKNNKPVDVEKSYVKITKTDDEYILKVNIKDSEKEDYVLVHIGCYTYCNSYVCEKKPSSGTVPVKGSNPSPTVPIKVPTPTYTPTATPTYSPTYTPTSTSTSTPAPKCYYDQKNNIYYGKDGYVVSKTRFERECTTPTTTPTSTATVTPIHKCYYDKKNNIYYGKTGKVVSKAQYEKECVTPTKTPTTSPTKTPTTSPTKTPTTSPTKTPTTSPTPTTTPTVEYEYQKTTATQFSAWTPWSSWGKTSCSTQEINCSDTDVNCLKKLQLLKRKEQIGTYQKTYAKTREVVQQTGSYTQKACSKYNYVVINKTIYATTTTTTYTQVNTITTTTRRTVGGWNYNGRASYSNPPRDTSTEHYVFVGADYSYCNDTCTTLPKFYYDSYIYTGGLTSVSSTTTPGSVSSSSTSSTSTSTTTTTQASCGEYVYKTIPIYGTVNVTEKATRTEPLYGDVCYASTKTRTITQQGQTQKKWSKYNDTTLLNAGWTYTGRTRTK